LLVLVAALGPWLIADALAVHSGQGQTYWAVSSGFIQGSFFWAVLVLAVASAWFTFGLLIKFGSMIALTGSTAAFFAGGVVFFYLTYIAAIFVHTLLFGGSI